MRPIGASAASKCCWPTISARRFGRSRSASGRGAWDSNNPVTIATPASIDTQRAGLPVSAERDIPAARRIIQGRLQVLDRLQLTAIDGEQDVAAGETEAQRRGAAANLDDDHALPVPLQL